MCSTEVGHLVLASSREGYTPKFAGENRKSGSLAAYPPVVITARVSAIRCMRSTDDAN